MNKLLEFLGEELFNKLKEAMGDQFVDFEQRYNSGELTDDDVRAKLAELGLTEEANSNAGGEGSPGESNDGSTQETNDSADGQTNEEEDEQTSESKDNTNKILLEGWLKETGEVDYDKILDETLRNYIKNLNERLKKAEWDYKFKMAITVEALKANMYDPSDADKFISIDELSLDENGNVVGVQEAFERLRKNKPHLFKTVEADGNNGFNPAKANKVSGYVPGMSFTEAYNL